MTRHRVTEGSVAPHTWIFDLDGTLLKDSARWLAAYNDQLSAIGAARIDQGEFQRRQRDNALSRDARLTDPNRRAEFWRGVMARFNSTPHLASPVDGAAAALSALARDALVGVITSRRAAEPAIWDELRCHDLASHVSWVVANEDAPTEEPLAVRRALIGTAERRYCVPMDRSVLVSDLPTDLRAARLAGVRWRYGVRTGGYPAAAFTPDFADAVLDSVATLHVAAPAPMVPPRPDTPAPVSLTALCGGPPAALLLDLDGVLVDSAEAIYHSWLPLFTEANLTLTLDECRRHIAAGDHGQRLRRRLESGRRRAMGEDEVRDRQLRRDRLVRRLGPQPGVRELLTLARSRGIKRAIVSDAPPSWMARLIPRLSPETAFDVVIRAGDVALPKPSPLGYLSAMWRLDAAPPACVAFEDTLAGATAAARAGMVVVVVVPTGQRGRLERVAHAVVPTLAAVTW
jgi:HAD superfamily hydrolase (TIGR01509 family)